MFTCMFAINQLDNYGIYFELSHCISCELKIPDTSNHLSVYTYHRISKEFHGGGGGGGGGGGERTS